jgi:formylglycine-generating enzyme required for sulfatase activity
MRSFFTSFTLLLLFIVSHSYSQEAILIVSLDIQPAHAVVFIDQQKVEVVDGRIELTEGKYQIRILKNGYDELNEEIKVNRKKAYFQFQLVENPNRVYPEDNAVIEIDDEDIKLEWKPTYVLVNSYEDAIIHTQSQDYQPNQPIEVFQNSIELMVYAPQTDTTQKILYIEEGDSVVMDIFPERHYTAQDIKIDLVLVKSGQFTMGKPGSKSNARLHQVELDEFYISKFEVTQAIWNIVMSDNPSKRVGDSLPVENVSWEEVQKFISRLNQMTDKNYRLPTEAEWEYAARGGHKMKEKFRYSGSDSIGCVGFYWKNSGDSILEGRWDNEVLKSNNCRIRKVGQLQPNELGICDMTGNVWEWCSDWYEEEYYVVSPLSNPQGPENGTNKVCRGGSYLSKASYCRNGFRFSYPPQNSYNYLGFRLVLDQ